VGLDKLAGILVGAACGDALGAGYEFRPPLPADSPVRVRGQGAFGSGEWTDDTAQLLAIALAAADGNELDKPSGEDAVAAYFQAWYLSPARLKDIGIHSSAVFGAVSALPADGLAERFRIEAADKEHRHPGTSGGNGALMRTASVALALHHDPERMVATAMRLASMTHADDRSTQSCAVWCLAIRRALMTSTPWDAAQVAHLRDDVIADVRTYLPTDSDYWSTLLEEAFGTSPVDYYDNRPGNGYCVTSLRAAWAAVTGTPVPADVPARHLRVGIESAVRGGGDTDTVACIAGALLGAMWGYSAAPLEWRRRIFGWPGYRDADLLRVADTIDHGGADRVDRSQWPHAAHIDYVHWSGTDAVAVHPFDDGVVLSGTDAAYGRVPLPGGAVDAVVSLCRLGTQDMAHLGIRPEDRVEVRLVDSASPADNPHLRLVLDDAADTVAGFRADGKRVLLHCVAAQSRTPTVATLYAIRHLGVAPTRALQQVCAALPDARPNSAFAALLRA
jgi:ADP-ribosylglycohydrolase/predicted protein tyrosine phosphatase